MKKISQIENLLIYGFISILLWNIFYETLKVQVVVFHPDISLNLSVVNIMMGFLEQGSK